MIQFTINTNSLTYLSSLPEISLYFPTYSCLFTGLFCVAQRSDPVVGYRESVSATSRIACLAKSTNKHNRLWMQASPLSDELVDEIQEVRSYRIYLYMQSAYLT